MNKIKYEKRMKELDQIAEEQQLRQQVRDRERELGLRRTRKKPAWGKAMMAVIYGLCIEIVIYAEIVMWMRFDLSALYACLGCFGRMRRNPQKRTPRAALCTT